MKPPSFQLRIALISALLSGLVLLACGAAFLAVIYRTGLKRVDQEIRALGESQMHQRLEHFSGGRFEESLRYIYGTEAGDRIVLRLLDFRGQVFYQSPHWPAGLDESQIPAPELSQAPPRDRRPRPGPPPGPGRDEDFLPERSDGPPLDEESGPPPMREPKFVTLAGGGTTWRLGVVGHEMATGVIGIDLAGLQSENRRYRTLFLASIPGALLLLGFTGWIVARRALGPMRLIAETAGRITARDLAERVPIVRSDAEFARLIDVINQMLERIERSFHQAARFSADAAHELKTPLTILQGQLEQAVQESAVDSAEQRTFAGLLDEVQRLKSITRKLLLLARADAGRLPLAKEQVDLSGAVLSAVEDARTLAPNLGISVDVPAGVNVTADPDLLTQVLQNLMTNAVKFNQSNGRIEVALTSNHRNVILAVANTGAAIAEADRERIFERFYRGDASHNRRVDGTGLGLSLSREIARAHGGELVLAQSGNGWNRFRLTLPAGA